MKNHGINIFFRYPELREQLNSKQLDITDYATFPGCWLREQRLTQWCWGLLLDRKLDRRPWPVPEPRRSGISSVLRGALPVWRVEACRRWGEG